MYLYVRGGVCGCGKVEMTDCCGGNDNTDAGSYD